MEPVAACALAERLLADELPRRWAHVRAVAAKADNVAAQLGLPDALVSAAWLHDIGYASALAATGFHPLDGARYLRGLEVDERVVELVAHHSCAEIEADTRGLDPTWLQEFALHPDPLADALLYCDMTTGPDGQSLTVADRLAEIRTRYGKGHPVTEFIEVADARIRSVVERTEMLLQAARR